MMIFEGNLLQTQGCSLNLLPGLLSHRKTHREITLGQPEFPTLVPTEVPTPRMLVQIQTSGCFSVEAGLQTPTFLGSCPPAAILLLPQGLGCGAGLGGRCGADGRGENGGASRGNRPTDLPAGGGNCRADFHTNTYPTLTGHFPWGNAFFLPCAPHPRPSPSSAPLMV